MNFFNNRRAFITLLLLAVLPSLFANSTYYVKEGDTAKSIAKTHLGSEEAAADLLRYNNLSLDTKLEPVP